MLLAEILIFPIRLAIALLQSINGWTEITIVTMLIVTWAKSPEKIPPTKTHRGPKSNYKPNYTSRANTYRSDTYKSNANTQPSYTKQTTTTPNDVWETVETYDCGHIYQNKNVFTEREKFAFAQLRSIVEKHGYSVLAKVRLFDLIEPSFLTDNKKVAQYKIQSKHVDFVLCDSNLKAQHVIELDDATHDRPDRIERDKFVDSALEMSGYRVLHTRKINEDEILRFIGVT